MDHDIRRLSLTRRAMQALRRHKSAAIGLALAVLAVLPVSADDPKLSGKVQIEQVQIAFIGSGNLGGGTLQYGGKTYSFTIGGLGVGGFGISKMQAVGEVYDLNDVRNFAGTYLQVRTGIAIADVGGGQLWLRNANGVYLHLQTKRQGLALSLGGDAIYVSFD